MFRVSNNPNNASSSSSSTNPFQSAEVGAWKLQGQTLSVKLSEDYTEHYTVKEEGGLWFQMEGESKISEGLNFEALLKECEARQELQIGAAPTQVDVSSSPLFFSYTKKQAADNLKGEQPGTFLFYPAQEKRNICLAVVEQGGAITHQMLNDPFGPNRYLSLEHYVQKHPALTTPYKASFPPAAPSFRIALPPKADAVLEIEYHKLPDNREDLERCTYARNGENYSQNRFTNIFPFDDNAFRGEGFYYNASLLFDGGLLAAQGPENKHQDDFWKMIWQSQCSTIVMLTKTSECCQYWPDEKEVLKAGVITIRLLSETGEDNRISRKLLLQRDNIERTVTHHQFTGFPDHGTAAPAEIAALVQKIGAFSPENPALAHCRAGIGRTGTLLAALMAYRQVQKDPAKGLDPELYFKTALQIRKERIGAIQTSAQYICGYRAFEELLKK